MEWSAKPFNFYIFYFINSGVDGSSFLFVIILIACLCSTSMGFIHVLFAFPYNRSVIA